MKRFIRSVLVCLVWILAVLAVHGQSYTPKPGETVVRIAVEGRGDIFVRLYTKEAPKTTAHVLKLVKDQFYDGLRFHKVERSPKPYIAVVGDPNSRLGVDTPNVGQGGSGTKIPFEDSGFLNEEGAVGLAHNVDDRDSGDSQFYMLLEPAKFLDGDYTVFGKVVAGMSVLQKVRKGDRVVSVVVLG